MIERSVVGPHVSIGANTKVSDTIMSNSLVQNDTEINHSNLKAAMIGAKASIRGTVQDMSVGDFCSIG